MTEKRKWKLGLIRMAVCFLFSAVLLGGMYPVSHAEGKNYYFETTGQNYTSFENTYSDGQKDSFKQPTFKNPGVPGTPYCIEPKIWFRKGEKTSEDFISYMKEKRNLTFTESDVTHFALALDYIENQMKETNGVNRNILAQAYLWMKLPAPDGTRIVNMKINGDETIAGRIVKEADAYAEENQDRAAGKAYAYDAGDAQALGSFSVEYFGRIRLKKTSELPDISQSSDLYSMKGAVYQILREDGSEAGTLTVDEKGISSESDWLLPGKYVVREKKAPDGFSLDTKEYPVTVTEKADLEISVREMPNFVKADLLLKKCTKDGNPLPISGAEYKISYSAGSKESESPDRSWIFKTDEKGEIRLSKEYLVSGDPLFFDADGNPVLPYGCYRIQEVKAPSGYTLDEKVYYQKLLGSGKSESTEAWNPVESLEEKEEQPKPDKQDAQKNQPKKTGSVKKEKPVNTGDSEKLTFYASALAVSGLLLTVWRRRNHRKFMG
ncbi:MAG: prealbumin-like fold domain-containing protein [Eubacteriales bacterium]|nr:prealbumin-like fold domain-containing protein [Eubacteriales bacterium]